MVPFIDPLLRRVFCQKSGGLPSKTAGHALRSENTARSALARVGIAPAESGESDPPMASAGATTETAQRNLQSAMPEAAPPALRMRPPALRRRGATPRPAPAAAAT